MQHAPRRLARRPRLPSAVTARAAGSTRRAGVCVSGPESGGSQSASTPTFASHPAGTAQHYLAPRSAAHTPRLVRLRRTRASHRAPAASVKGLHLPPSARSRAASPDRRPSSEVRRDALVSGAHAGLSDSWLAAAAPAHNCAKTRGAFAFITPLPRAPLCRRRYSATLSLAAQIVTERLREARLSYAHTTRSSCNVGYAKEGPPEHSGSARRVVPSILAVAPLPARPMHRGHSRISRWKQWLRRAGGLFRHGVGGPAGPTPPPWRPLVRTPTPNGQTHPEGWTGWPFFSAMLFLGKISP